MRKPMKSSNKYFLAACIIGLLPGYIFWQASDSFWAGALAWGMTAGAVFEQILKFMTKVRVVDAKILKD